MMRRMLIGVASLGVLVAALAIAPLPAIAADAGKPEPRRVVAVLPFSVAGGEPGMGAQAATAMQQALRHIPQVVTIDPGQVDAPLKNAAAPEATCSGVACAQRVGAALGVPKVLMGNITQQDPIHWRVTAMLVDVSTGTAERTVTLTHEGGFPEILDQGLPALAHRVLGLPAPEVLGMNFSGSTPPMQPASNPDRSPTPAPAQGSGGPPPHTGVAIYSGAANYTGKAMLKSGGSLIYSGDTFPNLGIEYQWALSGPWALAVFGEGAGQGVPSGKLSSTYDAGGPSLVGVELRYWKNRWYAGPNVGFNSVCFYNTSTRDGSPSDLCFVGWTAGAGGGYQWDNGVFAALQLEYSALEAHGPSHEPNVPKMTTAVEYDGWINVGYRWGH